jgi:hypothetical protein
MLGGRRLTLLVGGIGWFESHDSPAGGARVGRVGWGECTRAASVRPTTKGSARASPPPPPTGPQKQNKKKKTAAHRGLIDWGLVANYRAAVTDRPSFTHRDDSSGYRSPDLFNSDC